MAGYRKTTSRSRRSTTSRRAVRRGGRSTPTRRPSRKRASGGGKTVRIVIEHHKPSEVQRPGMPLTAANDNAPSRARF